MATQSKDVNFFPNLPPYSHPKTGFVSQLPSSWIPYAQLMRIDRPAGIYAVYLPYLIGIIYAACISLITPQPSAVATLVLILFPFNVLVRGIACTWNDNVDQQFDRRVERCRHRPIARGAVSTTQANIFTVAQIVLIYPFATFLLPSACKSHIATTIALFLVYALMKRVTYYPQVVLGISFAWAIFVCVAALGIEPFHGDHVVSTLSLFAANVLWTIIYDTIYAHQDIAYDEQAGVKSMALAFRNSTKILASFLAAGQVGLLALCGMRAGFGAGYFVGTVGGVAVTMAYYIYDFRDQFRIVGAAFLTGLLGEYLRKAWA
ncbi:hypothetical protein P154DRAFT_542506 [Amniculicola lignicola CBS 123094]|uniref:Uncharacterized protein n=1 Tax=Amniculicola lignicola CBS 123094 TaxID=1392246 RepID=A0A6A5WW86_9PLEO|nr:hypothetical protein P154DRAFT_542506 [Amniculicola lignicola CBS 123094]